MITQSILIPELLRPHPDVTHVTSHGGGDVFTVDFTPLLEEYNPHWQEQLLELAATHARLVPMAPSVSSRRDEGDISDMPIHTLSGEELKHLAPWTMDLAKSGKLERLAAFALEEEVWPPDVENEEYDRFRVIMNALYPGEAYETHVDTNGATWVVQASDHGSDKNSEGITVVSTNPSKRGFFKPESGDYRIMTRAGQGVLLHAHNMPHYITAPEKEVRPTLVYECYTHDANEGHRPATHNKDMGWA